MSILPSDRAIRDPAGHGLQLQPGRNYNSPRLSASVTPENFTERYPLPPPALRWQLNRDTLRSMENARLPPSPLPHSTSKQRLRRLI